MRAVADLYKADDKGLAGFAIFLFICALIGDTVGEGFALSVIHQAKDQGGLLNGILTVILLSTMVLVALGISAQMIVGTRKKDSATSGPDRSAQMETPT